jgi:TetR/AcrR family transcriptional regulator, transcriptional repressor for nem operon
MVNKGEQTREKILTEACRLFQLKGFRSTSISDLLLATGLKKGGFYFHYSSKDALGMAVLEHERVDLEAFLDRTLQGTSPGRCLQGFFQGTLDLQRQMKFVGGCIFGNTALEMGDADERFAHFVKEVFADYIARIGEVVVAAQASGEVRSDLAAEVLAHHIVAATEGGIMLARLQKREAPLKDCFDSLQKLLGLQC